MKRRINVMEQIVEQKVLQMLENQFSWCREIIDPEDVISFALNQLPSYYATTQRELILYRRKIELEKRKDFMQAIKEGFLKYSNEAKPGAKIPANEIQAEQQLRKLKKGLSETLNAPLIKQLEDGSQIMRHVRHAIRKKEVNPPTDEPLWI